MPIIPDFWPDLRPSLNPAHEYSADEQYFLSSKTNPEYFTLNKNEGVKAYFENGELTRESQDAYKTYLDRPRFPLSPDFQKFKHVDWDQVVRSRRSTHHFSERPIEYSELSNLLVLSCGLKQDGEWLKTPRPENPWPRRSLPSGGALYPLEYYVLASQVAGLPAGLYHFDVRSFGLSQLRTDPDVLDLQQFWPQVHQFGHPAALLFVSAVFRRSRIKYGAKALRLILLEAGGVGTHMNLLSTVMGLGFCFDGGANDSAVEKLIGLDGRKEGLVTAFSVGHPTTGRYFSEA